MDLKDETQQECLASHIFKTTEANGGLVQTEEICDERPVVERGKLTGLAGVMYRVPI